MVLVEAVPDEQLNKSLSADMEFPGRLIQFFYNVMVEINPHALKRRHHLAFVSEVRGYIASFVCELSYRFRGYRSFGLRDSLHKAFVPRW